MIANAVCTAHPAWIASHVRQATSAPLLQRALWNVHLAMFAWKVHANQLSARVDTRVPLALMLW